MNLDVAMRVAKNPYGQGYHIGYLRDVAWTLGQAVEAQRAFLLRIHKAIRNQKGGEVMKAKKKPCEESCPKCGGTDVCRNWIPRGKKVVMPNYKTITGNSVEYFAGKHSVDHDRIRHYCRCCHYEWDTKTQGAKR